MPERIIVCVPHLQDQIEFPIRRTSSNHHNQKIYSSNTIQVSSMIIPQHNYCWQPYPITTTTTEPSDWMELHGCTPTYYLHVSYNKKSATYISFYDITHLYLLRWYDYHQNTNPIFRIYKISNMELICKIIIKNWNCSRNNINSMNTFYYIEPKRKNFIEAHSSI